MTANRNIFNERVGQDPHAAFQIGPIRNLDLMGTLDRTAIETKHRGRKRQRLLQYAPLDGDRPEQLTGVGLELICAERRKVDALSAGIHRTVSDISGRSAPA